MVESSSGTGVGSIWNKNSWHWEERNYTELAKKWLFENLVKIEHTSEKEQVSVRLYEVKSVEGSCSITIRKQKQIFLFEFKLEIYFDSVDLTGEEEEKRMGRLLVEEFNQDDLDGDIDFSVVSEKPGEFTNRTKRALQTEVKAQVLKVIGELRGVLQQIDANEEKIRRDAAEREQAAKEYQEAQKDKGDVKMQIFEEQKKKEAELKEKAKELLLQQQAPQKVDKKVEGGQGSVWNTGNYFWEEKSVAKWAEERLKTVLGGFSHAIPSGEFKIVAVDKLKGEASVSIRKGKKIVAYDYSAVLKWEVSVRDGEGNVVASLKGSYELPEVSSDIEDDGEQWEVRPSIKEETPAGIKSRYESTLIRKEVPEAIRKAIREGFVAELKQK